MDTLNVDRNVDARWQVQFLELINRLGGRLDDIDESFMRARLELLHGFLIHVRGAVDREFLDTGWQRDRAGDAGAGALGGLDNFRGRLVDDAIVKTLKLDADALAFLGDAKNGV
jgi:hypothetical protein